MKLYYSAGSCSTSCHITLEESGLPYEAIEIDFDNESDPNLKIINQLNPLGTLPILVTSTGKQLDQNLAIHSYVADLATDKKLLPAAGTIERAEAMNWLSFVAADLHKSIGAFFSLPYMTTDPKAKEENKKFLFANANEHIAYLDQKLNGKNFMMGNQFTAADAYAFVVLGWTKWVEIPLTPYKNVEAYLARIAARPAVATVLKAEGLI
jgi:glutathione S-transferase